jgi:GNAT superfamily N-acetyltransferase
MQWNQADFIVSDDPHLLDIDVVLRLLAGSYWGAHRTRDVVERSIRHSIPFGLYHDKKQIGFARLVTDRATFAWLADVLIDPAYRGKGLGKWLVQCALAHPEIGTTVQLLRTRDAHSLYEPMGFQRIEAMLRNPLGYNWNQDRKDE